MSCSTCRKPSGGPSATAEESSSRPAIFLPPIIPQGKTGVSPNGVLEITRLNMFGRDQTLTFRIRFGLLTRRGLVSYEAPRLFRRENWRFIVSGFYDNTADVNTFASETLEGSRAGRATL